MTNLYSGSCSILAGFLLLVAPVGAEPGITIEVAMFEGGEGLGFFLDCARAYEEIHPGTSVNLHGDPRISDKLRVRVLEGSFPEVICADLNFWKLIRNGDLMPFDEFLDQANWEGDRTWRESFLPGTLERYSYNGKVYGVPLSYFAMGIWYNKGMFEAHEWRVPATVEDLFDLCDEIKAAGIPPIAFQGRYPAYAQMMNDAIYYQLAGRERYYAQQNLETGSFWNPEQETALRLVQKLANDYFQEGCMGMSHTEAQLQFFLGRTAMIPCGAWLKSEMMDKIPDGFRLGFFNFPAVDNAVSSANDTQVHMSYFHVMRESRHPEEAVEFIRFITSREMSARFCSERDIPVAVRGGNEGNQSPDMEDLVAVVNASSMSYGRAPGEGYPDMVQVWADVWSKLLIDKVSPSELCEKLEGDAAAIRARAADPNHVSVQPGNARNTKVFLGIVVAMMVLGSVAAVRNVREMQRPEAQLTAGRTKPGWKSVALFIGPAALLYTVFVIVPSLRAFPWSLNRWDGLTAMQPVGLLNFRRLLLENQGFWIAVKNNLFIMVVIPLFVIPLSLFLAACISRGLWGARLFRVAFFFPNIIGGVAATLLWMHLYNPQGGPLHVALSGVGAGFVWLGTHMSFLSDGLIYLGQWFQEAWLTPSHLYWALVPMSIWGACGFNMILFLAAMESIPIAIYEAAEIDGASPLRQFWTITIPLIWEVLSIAVVFMVIGGMKTFEVIWLLTNQAPATETHVVGTCMVQAMFKEYKVGEAAAIAVLLFVMVFLGTIATMRAMKRKTVRM